MIKGHTWQWAIIGIGLNVNQEAFESPVLQAISLKQLTGKSFDTRLLANKLHEKVLEKISDLKNGNFNAMLNSYNNNLYARNKKVKLKKGNIIFETTVERISSSGELITKDVMERTFGFDEVEWIASPQPPEKSGLALS